MPKNKNRDNNKMVEQITAGIRVQVETAYQLGASEPAAAKYVFAYRIRIRNEGDQTVQLLNRHWDICDSLQSPKTVDGPGVVGHQPVLAPGEEFVYTSGCQLGSEFGTMEGHYEMTNLITGENFDVGIPEFRLEVPFRLN